MREVEWREREELEKELARDVVCERGGVEVGERKIKKLKENEQFLTALFMGEEEGRGREGGSVVEKGVGGRGWWIEVENKENENKKEKKRNEVKCKEDK